MPKKGKVAIELERCKGCGICVAFCPRDVLKLNDNNKSEVKDMDECIGCELCALRCPDFAIKVEVVDNG